MIKVMFVCHGNICRSPMAEIVLRDMLEREGMSAEVSVASSATSTEELGNPIYPPARAELLRRGYVLDDKKRSVQLQKSDYDRYDLFVCMDRNNLRNMGRIFGEDKQGKMHMLMDYTEQGGEVADPWFTGHFDVTYEDVRRGCEGLVAHLKKIMS